MIADLVSRALVAALLIGAGFGLYRLATRVLLTRAREKGQGLETRRPGWPAVLYFTTPDCAPCRTIQRPELSRLARRLGDRVQIIEIDALAQPHLADYWGVLSVPTTFIIDSQGRARHVNHGVTRAEKLIEQIQAAESRLGPAASDSHGTWRN